MTNTTNTKVYETGNNGRGECYALALKVTGPRNPLGVLPTVRARGEGRTVAEAETAAVAALQAL